MGQGQPGIEAQRRLERGAGLGVLAGQEVRRPELDVGIGGARSGAGSLKCLHAHVAFALARPGYELGERILAELEPLFPDACCST